MLISEMITQLTQHMQDVGNTEMDDNTVGPILAMLSQTATSDQSVQAEDPAPDAAADTSDPAVVPDEAPAADAGDATAADGDEVSPGA